MHRRHVLFRRPVELLQGASDFPVLRSKLRIHFFLLFHSRGFKHIVGLLKQRTDVTYYSNLQRRKLFVVLLVLCDGSNAVSLAALNQLPLCRLSRRVPTTTVAIARFRTPLGVHVRRLAVSERKLEASTL